MKKESDGYFYRNDGKRISIEYAGRVIEGIRGIIDGRLSTSDKYKKINLLMLETDNGKKALR